jgi:protein TonB
VNVPQPAPSTGSGDGIPLGSPSSSPGSGPTGPGRVASASGRDAGSTGAITQYARPQGGYQVRPGYPATARRLGIQGTTMLRVHVLVDGRVGDVVVQETAGHPDLDEAAAEAVRRWRFDPARRGNDPVAMWVLLPVEFRLK